MLRIIYVVLMNLFRAPYLLSRLRKMSKNADQYPLRMRYLMAKKVFRYVRRSGHIKTECIGVENLPKEGGYMMFPNHQGKYDVLAIVHGHDEPCSFVMDKKKSYTFFVKEIVDLLDAKRMEIDNIRQALTVINELAEDVKEGKKYIIFPEGGYSNNHNTLQDFKPGSFKSATKAKVPVVPVCLIDTYKPFNSLSIKPVSNKVIFLKPIMPKEYENKPTTWLADEVKSRIIDTMWQYGIEQ